MSARIALVVPNLPFGGGVSTVARFIRNVALASNRFELQQISLTTTANDPCSVRLANVPSWMRGVRYIERVDGIHPYTHVGAFGSEFEFQRYSRRATLTHLLKRCDLIQVVCGSPAWANAVVDLGKPVALQVATLARVERRQRDARPGSAKGLWRKAMTAITGRLDNRALRRVDAIQVENPWMLEYACHINRERSIDIRYAPPGVDSLRYAPVASEERLRDPYILCVGRLGDPRKRIDMLLEAYAQLPAATRAASPLVLAGSSAPPLRFQQRVEALGLRDRIRYVRNPDADALLALYQYATVFALPSDEEGFGMVLIEAMACGVPVVATRCGGPDGIITDGKDGLLVPRDDASALCAGLELLLHDVTRNEAMGAAARKTVERRYDARVTGETFVDMWDRQLHKTKSKWCAD